MLDSQQPPSIAADRTARSISVTAVLLCALLFMPGMAAGQVDLGDIDLDSSRLPSWNAGVSGGMPDTSSWIVHSSIPGGASAGAIQSAIDSAAAAASPNSGRVVKLGPGTIEFPDGTAIRLRSNVVLRGAGMNATKIRGTSSSFSTGRSAEHGLVFIAGTRDSGVLSVRNGSLPKGTRVFQVDSGDSDLSSIRVGDWVAIEAVRNSDFDFIDIPDRGDTVMHHMGQVTAKSGGNITIDRPLRHQFTDGLKSGVTLRRVSPVSNAGIEDLTVETRLNTREKWIPLVNFAYSVNSWFNHSRAQWGNRHNINIAYSAGITVANSEIGTTMWFHCNQSGVYSDVDGTSCSNGRTRNSYSVQFARGAQDSLIINNVMYDQAINVRFRGGNHGNVFAYNYIRDSNTPSHGIFFHGQYPYENLVEGNDTDAHIQAHDRFWGRQGPNNTIYRNRLRSNSDWGIVKNEPSAGEGAPYSGVDTNIIGNNAFAFGRIIFCDYSGKGNCGDIDDGAKGSWLEYNVARDTRTTGEYGFILNTPNSDTHHHDNVEAKKAPASWANLDIPASLYFESRQDWERQSGTAWCQEACAWDAHEGIGAFGDDFSKALCKLPAQIEDEGGTCTPFPDSGASAPEPEPAPPPPTSPAPTQLEPPVLLQ